MIYIQKQGERRRILEARCSDGFRCHDIRTIFGRDLFRNSQVDGRKEIKRYIDSRQHGDYISMLSFSQTKDSRLKSLYVIYIELCKVTASVV
jgi:hypothetical protein